MSKPCGLDNSLAICFDKTTCKAFWQKKKKSKKVENNFSSSWIFCSKSSFSLRIHYCEMTFPKKNHRKIHFYGFFLRFSSVCVIDKYSWENKKTYESSQGQWEPNFLLGKITKCDISILHMFLMMKILLWQLFKSVKTNTRRCRPMEGKLCRNQRKQRWF